MIIYDWDRIQHHHPRDAAYMAIHVYVLNPDQFERRAEFRPLDLQGSR